MVTLGWSELVFLVVVSVLSAAVAESVSSVEHLVVVLVVES